MMHDPVPLEWLPAIKLEQRTKSPVRVVWKDIPNLPRRTSMLSTPYQAIARTIVAVTAACGLFIPISGASEIAALDAAFRDETVLAVAGMVEDGYVYPEMGHRLAEHLRQSLRTGGYDEMETGGQLAGKLTGDLRSLSEDLHFRVVYSPPHPTAEVNTAVEDEPSPADRRERRLNLLRRDNFGFRSLQQKPGNVFCIELERFLDPGMAGDTAVAAMNFVANAEAIIIDLRSNRGGDPRMVQFLASYFLESPVQLTGLYWRSIDGINQSWTLPHVQGKRLLHTDLYILTSRSTFSAAEAFA